MSSINETVRSPHRNDAITIEKGGTCCRSSGSDDDSVVDDDEFETVDFERLRQRDSPFYSIKRSVTYEGTSHLDVICQLHGSVWKHVLPYCIVNVIWTYAISYLKTEYEIDITLPSAGHKFMVILVSFLVVTRVQITYNRFIESRNNLGECFRSSRELMHNICLLTMESDGQEAKDWRTYVAIRIVRMLRITIAAIEFKSKDVNPWDFLPPENIRTPHDHSIPVSEFKDFLRKNKHHDRNKNDNALRAPLIYSGIIRASILLPQPSNGLNRPMTGQEELNLLGHATKFASAYHGLNKLITTPFPFPLVQKTRTILLAWLFSLPLALVHDAGDPFEEMIMIFFVTYGFLGLEYVSIELDDPFGNDDNDFDNLGMAQRVYEDIYMTLFDNDGKEAAESLRKTVST